MKYFDAHTHVQFAAYDADRDAAVQRALEAGVGMNIVGTQIDTSRAATAHLESVLKTQTKDIKRFLTDTKSGCLVIYG